MENTEKSFKNYIKELLMLAVPIFLGALGHTLIGAGDVFVIAKYGVKELSAVSIANSIFFTLMIFGIGILASISIILSNYRGAKQRVKKYLPSIFLLSILLSGVFSAVCFFSKYLIPYIGLEAELVPYIQEYLSIVSFSLAGVFIYEGIKQFLQAFEIVKFPNYLSLFTVLLNLAVNFIFVFGFWIIPGMGVKGAAAATLVVRSIGGAAMLIYAAKLFRFKNGIDWKIIKNIIKTGLPIGIALLFEFLAFNIVTVLAGKEDSLYAAVHSILITIVNASYTAPFALASALTVKISYWFGAGKPLEVKKYAYTALYFVLILMSFLSLILALWADEFIAFFTPDKAVMAAAAPVISIAAAYQIFDGLQAVTGGILRGFKHTKTSGLCTVSSYWLIGAPIAYILVTKYNMHLKGYWAALAVSLFSMGIIQAAISKYYYKKFAAENL